MLSERLRLLIVDDNELNCDLIRYQLEDFAFTVDAETDSNAALRALSSTFYSLVLLDLRMPILDGYQVLRRLRDNAGPNRNTPVIAVTAQERGFGRRALLDEGFADLLYKPLAMDALLLSIARFVPVYANHTAADYATPPASVDLWSHVMARCNGDALQAGLLLEKLLNELPRQMENIRLLLSLARNKAVQEQVHKLYGLAAYCGLKDIVDAANNFERALLLKSSNATQYAACHRLNATISELLQQRDAIMTKVSSHKLSA